MPQRVPAQFQSLFTMYMACSPPAPGPTGDVTSGDRTGPGLRVVGGGVPLVISYIMAARGRIASPNCQENRTRQPAFLGRPGRLRRRNRWTSGRDSTQTEPTSSPTRYCRARRRTWRGDRPSSAATWGTERSIIVDPCRRIGGCQGCRSARVAEATRARPGAAAPAWAAASSRGRRWAAPGMDAGGPVPTAAWRLRLVASDQGRQGSFRQYIPAAGGRLD